MLNLFKDQKPWTPPATKGMLQKQSINHKHINNIKLLYYKSLMADSIASITYSIALSASYKSLLVVNSSLEQALSFSLFSAIPTKKLLPQPAQWIYFSFTS